MSTDNQLTKTLPDLHGSSFDYLVIVNLVYTSNSPAPEVESPKFDDVNSADTVPTLPTLEIIDLPWIVLDLHTGRVVDQQQILVKPASLNHIPQTFEESTGLKVTSLPLSAPLQEVLRQFDDYITAHFVAHNKSFCFLTEGNTDLEVVLKNEAHTKRIQLPSYFSRYFDVRCEFEKCFPHMDEPDALDTIMEYFDIHLDHKRHPGIEDCRIMSIVVNRLLQNGHRFVTPECLEIEKLSEHSGSPKLLSAILDLPSNHIENDEPWVVRLRGLPWDATERNIRGFFEGIPIPSQGILFTFNQYGKPSGEAYVVLSSEDDMKNALQYHKRIMGKRYIEVFKSTALDMSLQKRTLSKSHLCGLNDHQLTMIRMRGLPSSSSLDDLEHFFEGFSVTKDDIHLVTNAEDTFVGEAFIQLNSSDIVDQVVDSLDRKPLLGRHIELFPCNNSEMTTVINRWKDAHTLKLKDYLDEIITEDGELSVYSSHSASHSHHEMPLHPPLDYSHTSPDHTDGHRSPTSCHSTDDCFSFADFDDSTAIRLRGLPLSVHEDDIADIFGDLSSAIAPNGVHILHNAQDRPTGEAYVEFLTQADCVLALAKHKPTIYDRSVEFAHCTRGEMLMALGYFSYNCGLVPNMDIPVMDIHPPKPPQTRGEPFQDSILAAPTFPPADTQSSLGNQFRSASPPNTNGITGFSTAAFSQLGSSSHSSSPMSSSFMFGQSPVTGGNLPFQLGSSNHHQTQNQTTIHPALSIHHHGHVIQHNHNHSHNQSNSHSHHHIHNYPGHNGGHHGTGLSNISTSAIPAPPRSLKSKSAHTLNPSGPTTVRMRGLPFRASTDAVVDFFTGYGILSDTILFGVDRFGRPSGEAWVSFFSVEEAHRAFRELNHKHMGSRYIELFL